MVYTQLIPRIKQVKDNAQQTTLSSKQLLLFTFTWQNVPPFQCVKLQFCFIFLPWINLWMVRSTDYSTTHHIKHEPLWEFLVLIGVLKWAKFNMSSDAVLYAFSRTIIQSKLFMRIIFLFALRNLAAYHIGTDRPDHFPISCLFLWINMLSL